MTFRRNRVHAHPLLGLAARIALAFGLLGAALWLSRDQIQEVLAHRPDYRFFAVGFALYFSGVLLAYARWYLLVRAIGLPFTLRDALRLGMIGTLFNMVIPGAIGGDVVKAAYLAREQDRKERAIATIVIDRIVGLLGLFLLASLTGVWFWATLGRRVRRLVIAAWIALAITTAILVLCFALNPEGPLARRLSRRRKTGLLIAELHATGLAYRKRFGVVLLGIVLGAVTHLGNILAFDWLGRAMFPASEVPTLTQDLMIVPLVLFSTAIPLPFGALGASEGVSAVLFRAVQFKGGAVTMLAFRLLQLVAAGLGALVYMANRQQVKNLAESVEELVEEPLDRPLGLNPHLDLPTPTPAPSADH